MKKLTTTMLLCAAMLAFPAAAAIAPAAEPQQQTTAEKDALTVEQVLTVGSGLQQLVRYESTDKDGKAFTAFYDFDPDTRMVIAINLDVVRRTQVQFQSAYNDLVMKWQDPATGKIPDNKQNAFNVEAAKLSSAQSRVGFHHVKKQDLRLEKNPIPGPVLSLIIPIVDR